MTSHHLSLCLIETAPAGQQGSMARYADLVASSLHEIAVDSGISFTQINLALSAQTLSKVPTRFRMWIHHGWI